MTIPDYPHVETIEFLAQQMESSKEGLNQAKVQQNLSIYGLNEIKEKKHNLFLLFLSQFKSPLVYVLVAAAALSLFLQNMHEGVLILLIVIINSCIGFWQEVKALSSIKALKKLTESKTQVKRNNQTVLISSSQLVPGDVIVLSEGDIVPADIRLFYTNGLVIDESILTGESIPVQKDANLLLHKTTLPYELDNMALSGTTVTKGKAEGFVVFTAEKTYLASLSSKAEEKSPETPLSKALEIFIKKHMLVILLLIVFSAIFALWQGRGAIEVIYLIIAELVSAVPEGLPIVVTLVLTIGAMTLSLKKVYIRHLPSVETLGSATVIASDKTGTITQGKLKVEEVFSLHDTFLQTVSALANESIENKGDPIDTALALWIGKEYENIREKYPRVNLYPFDTQYRLMASSNMIEREHKIFVKGAFESLKLIATNQNDFETLEREHDKLASNGLRVIALGMGEHTSDNIEKWRIEIVGLVGFLDPPKEGVLEAVQTAQRAGIKVMMITGDNPLTAAAVAKLVNIYKEEDLIATGKELNDMDDETLEKILPKITVWARVLPEHKYRIVKMLQKQGEIVAVTGDGANDVPALRAADLGIGMGSGTDAAKSTAKMVLADNNLTVIVDAIKQGRTIAGNIRKAIYFLVSTSLDEVILITGAILMSLPLPLYPVQILWINLVSDSALDKTFPFLKEEEDVMSKAPTKLHEKFLDKTQLLRVVYAALVISMGALFLYVWMLEQYGKESAVSTLFSAFVVATWVNGLQSLKENEPFLKNIKKSLQINPYIFHGIGIGLVLQLCAIYLLSDVFHALPLTIESSTMIGLMALWVFSMIEIRKWAEILLAKKDEESTRLS
ncbi:MAG TPA: cation-transporting P-type ATPase [Sulfurovum sp.]|jgi:Ca2+-transporting ATPase|nr:MAG: cation transporter [Sulfurovum sp. 35-42-20]OYZ26335.1 MAG: cation transporter [Sulfurovum sp. 16-42-52]OYZ48809.1 MAG: cation transporter [Sulfurovum sp. 24-42-9]OZA46487.1 MAG: cation transporter [Sulfurovum sp. 17-42-90]OZA59093.1 MAG: cation transporter [Sulfurovum sp. 39-42-12]HQR74250.1 cation-transporting P-type ATPase [Sulfurovum sp.]